MSDKAASSVMPWATVPWGSVDAVGVHIINIIRAVLSMRSGGSKRIFKRVQGLTIGLFVARAEIAWGGCSHSPLESKHCRGRGSAGGGRVHGEKSRMREQRQLWGYSIPKIFIPWGMGVQGWRQLLDQVRLYPKIDQGGAE